MGEKVKKAIEGLAAAIWERPERAEASLRATTVPEVDGFSTAEAEARGRTA